MIYLLDTTAFSAFMRRDTKIRNRVSALTPNDQLAICTTTRGEVLYGIERLPHGKRRSDLEAEATHLFAQLVCLSVPEAAGDRYAYIKRETERKGTSLDENDLWIAMGVRSCIIINFQFIYQLGLGHTRIMRTERWYY